MKRTRHVLTGPFFTALLGMFFCIWSAFGNDVNICVTAGCSLYEDFTLAGISMWWYGTAVFVLLVAMALLGLSGAGLWIAGLALFCDLWLLLLLALTAPCISCLGVAILFALTFQSFRLADRAAQHSGTSSVPPRRSVLLWVWLLLFTVNVGAVLRSEAGVWPILNENSEATVHMYFSPSCPSCRQGIELLSGHIDVAFYPVADDAMDTYRILRMQTLLDEGQNLAEALQNSLDAQPPSFLGRFAPDVLLLRFRLLRNKAHIYAANARTVPFLEYHGLPSALVRQAEARMKKHEPSPAPQKESVTPAPVQPFPSEEAGSEEKSSALPLEPQIAGSCGNGPCKESTGTQSLRPRHR